MTGWVRTTSALCAAALVVSGLALEAASTVPDDHGGCEIDVSRSDVYYSLAKKQLAVSEYHDVCMRVEPEDDEEPEFHEIVESFDAMTIYDSATDQRRWFVKGNKKHLRMFEVYISQEFTAEVGKNVLPWSAWATYEKKHAFKLAKPSKKSPNGKCKVVTKSKWHRKEKALTVKLSIKMGKKRLYTKELNGDGSRKHKVIVTFVPGLKWLVMEAKMPSGPVLPRDKKGVEWSWDWEIWETVDGMEEDQAPMAKCF